MFIKIELSNGKTNFFLNKFKTHIIILDASFLDFKIIDFSDIQMVLSKCQGNAAKGIFICSSDMDVEVESFLTKILSAVQLDLNGDVLLLKKTIGNGFSFSSLKEHHPIQKVLVFGLAPSNLGIHINSQKYQPLVIGGTTFLFCDELTSIANNQNLKKSLWVALQGMFPKT